MKNTMQEDQLLGAKSDISMPPSIEEVSGSLHLGV